MRRHETLSATAWLGFACVVAGVIAMTLPAGVAGRSRLLVG